MEKIVGLLLSSARLITLIGPGGIGKTSVAAEVVRRIRKSSSAPVYWVRLARLSKGSDSAAVEEAVSHEVVGSDFSGRPGWETLVAKLTMSGEAESKKNPVLVMDNCEHVLEGAGQVITDLLEAVPGSTILATSREAVGWVDEYLVAIPSLPLEHAVVLFRQRAELTGHPIGNKGDLALATRICRHMNNSPLYIRLAAARLSQQPLEMIARELSGEVTDKRTRWAHWPRFGAEPRHRGVRDAIAWSYDLCQDRERLLLDRMSVFAAGYDTSPEGDVRSAADVGVDLDTIVAVCSDDHLHRADSQRLGNSVTLSAEDIGGVLERLVDQSLVTAHRTPTTVRYSLLESVRVFGAQRLAERSTAKADEPARLAGRHRRYYRDKMIAAQMKWFRPGARDLFGWIRAAWDNLAKAIETSLNSGDAALGLEVSTSLMLLPFVIGSPREVRGWIQRTLQATRMSTSTPDDLQIRAMALIGWSALMAGKTAEGEQMLADCTAACLRGSKTMPDLPRALQQDIGLPAPAEFAWGTELLLVHRDPMAITVFARARQKATARGDLGFEIRCSDMETWAASFVGSAQQALQITRHYLDVATASDSEWAKGFAENARAVALAKHANPTEALYVARSALAHHMSTRDSWGESWAVHIRIYALARAISAMMATAGTDRAVLTELAREAAQLVGGAATLRAELSIEVDDLRPFAGEIAEAIEVVRSVLGRDAFATERRKGSLLRSELREVQRLALGTLSTDRLPIDHPARKGSPSHWYELSTAEQHVAILAAAGWTNSAIAARRGSSSKTIEAQMAAILRKLVINSREHILELVPENEIESVRSAAATRSVKNRPGPRMRDG
ncbi:ATP-binding protein [Nocardia exalbida]|uniref:ATP-binding protein n=1 Tax=Nocardia exalbida TaxID=290231 RepID=UPI0002EDF7A6|nr:LuxR C-terminal-related transcriptional regulator [Nocardia exalbida]